MRSLTILIFFKISISISFIKEFFFSPQILRNILQNSSSDEKNDSKITHIFNVNDTEMLGKLATHFVEKTLNILWNHSNVSIPCQNYVKDILGDTYEYINNFNENISDEIYTSREFVIKMALDSSKTTNELTYYDSCLNMSRLNYPGHINNYTYFELLIDCGNKNKSSIDYEESYYLYGYCVPHNGNTSLCSPKDYQEIYKVVNNFFKNAFSPQQDNQIMIPFFVNKYKFEHKKENFIFSIVILSIFVFWMVLVFFSYPIFLMLKLCFRKKKNFKHIKKEGNDKGIIGTNIDNKYFIPKWLIKLKSCFSLNENFEELFNVKTNTASMSNYSGLTEIRGLTSISMFFTILGFTFLGVFNCPVKSTGIYQIRALIYHYLYIFIFIGLRFSPRIIISCNGYTLMYKYLCYIDKNIENFSASKFVIYQSYKYFLFIFLFLFFRFTLDYIYVLSNGDLPIWRFFHNIFMEKESNYKFNNKWYNLLADLLGYKHFLINHNKLIEKDLIDYFWVPFNDIFCFFFGIILITIGYKFKLRIDIFILILIPLTLIGKVAFSYFLTSETFYSTIYYYLLDYGKFMTNPFFNLPYFLIGLYFGLMNYALQNGIMNKIDSSIYSKIGSFSFLSKSENEEKGDMFQDDKEEEKKKNKDKNNIINNSNEISNSDILKEDEEKEKEELISNINNQEKIEENEDDNFSRPSKEPVKTFETEIIKFPFLKIPIKYINYRKRNSEIFIYIIILLVIFAPIVVHRIFLILNENELPKSRDYAKKTHKNDNYLKILNLESYLSSNVVNAVFRVDIEFFVFFIQLLIFILQIKGRKNILSFFTDIKWGIFSKSYFSFSIVCNMVILFTIYSAESIISLNIYTIYLYFIFNTILIVILMSLAYIFFELPLKKLTKNIFYKSEDNNDNDEVNDDDDIINDNKIDKLELDNIDIKNEFKNQNKEKENKLETEDDDDDE